MPFVSVLVPPSGQTFAGVERVSFNLASGLALEDFRTQLVLSEPLPDLPSQDQPVELEQLNCSRLRRLPVRLTSYLRERAPDVLVVPHIPVVNAVVIAKRLAHAKVRIIGVVHGNPHEDARTSVRNRLAYAAFGSWVAGRIDALVAVSRGTARATRHMLTTEPPRMLKIANPLVSENVVELARVEANHPWLSESTPILLGAGRLHPSKAFDVQIRAFARLRRKRDVRMLIMGEGGERAYLERLVESLGLGHDVQLIGFQPNPYAFMARAAVVVVSSRHEGLSNVLVEALAVGTSVVAADCPYGPREILGGGRWGRLVPVGDPDALSRAMGEALDDPGLAAPRRRRAQYYSVRRSVHKYGMLIRSILEPRKTGPRVK